MVGPKPWSVMILGLHCCLVQALSVIPGEPLVSILGGDTPLSGWILGKGTHMDDAVNDVAVADAGMAEGAHADGAEDASSGS